MKSRLQKFICMTVSILIFSMSLSGNAIAELKNRDLKHETNSKIKIVFDESEYDGMSELEAGIEKVNKYGLKNNIADNMDEEILKSIGRSQYMTRDITYLIENKAINSSQSYSYENSYNLIEVDEQTYNNLLEKNNIINKLKSNVIVIDENGNEIAGNTLFNSGETSGNIDSGKMRMLIDSYHYVDSNNNYFYDIVNQFIWDTMPKGRGTDIFGISRGNNTARHPNSEGGYYEYLEQAYGGFATINGWNPSLISSEIKTVDCENDDLSYNSSAIRIDMPIDNIPSTVIVGNYYYARIYPALLGVTWYRGTLAQITIPSINNIEHWGTLQHQNKGKLSLNPSFGVSYPLNASFSINPTYSSQYTKISTSILDTITVSYK